MKGMKSDSRRGFRTQAMGIAHPRSHFIVEQETSERTKPESDSSSRSTEGELGYNQTQLSTSLPATN